MYPCIPLITKIAGLDSHVPPTRIPLSGIPGAMDQLCHPRKLPTPLSKSTVTKLYWFCLSVLSAVCFWTKRQVSTFRASLPASLRGRGRKAFKDPVLLLCKLATQGHSGSTKFSWWTQMAPLSLFTQYSPSPGVPRLLGEHGWCPQKDYWKSESLWILSNPRTQGGGSWAATSRERNFAQVGFPFWFWLAKVKKQREALCLRRKQWQWHWLWWQHWHQPWCRWLAGWWGVWLSWWKRQCWHQGHHGGTSACDMCRRLGGPGQWPWQRQRWWGEWYDGTLGNRKACNRTQHPTNARTRFCCATTTHLMCLTTQVAHFPSLQCTWEQHVKWQKPAWDSSPSQLAQDFRVI